MKRILIVLNVLSSLSILALAGPVAEADPEVKIEVNFNIGSPDQNNGPADEPAAAEECLSPWVNVGDGCYLFDITYYNWIDAQAFCETNGGQLAVLKTETERTAMAEYMIEAKPAATWRSWWLGGNNVYGGEWLWLDGSPITSGWLREGT